MAFILLSSATSYGQSPPRAADADGTNLCRALSDGVLALRYLQGATGDALVRSALGEGSTRTAAQVTSFFEDYQRALDVDGDSRPNAAVDATLLTRYLFGFRGASLTQGLTFHPEARRRTPAEFESYLGNICVQACAQNAVANIVSANLEVAQTHVIPAQGKSWTNWGLDQDDNVLRLIGYRDTLVMAELGANPPAAPALEAWRNDTFLGRVALDPPALLPPTESNGVAYATDRHSATIPREWMVPGAGMRLRVVGSACTASAFQPLNVGMDTETERYTLDMQLFGAAWPVASQADISVALKKELFAKMPVAKVHVTPLRGRAQWDYLIIAPGTISPQSTALKVRTRAEAPGYVQGAALNAIAAIGQASGLALVNANLYGRLVGAGSGALGNQPGVGSVGDELGYSGRETGFGSYWFHESGHNYGLNHSNEAYLAVPPQYPYPGGSLAGSNWGYDSERRRFLGTFVPPDAVNFARCRTRARPAELDAQNRCVKQDPMESGIEDAAAGDVYGMFSDYYAAKVQRRFEGRTTVRADGSYTYRDAYPTRDPFSNTYRRWNSVLQKSVPVARSTVDFAWWGEINLKMPHTVNTPVHIVVLTISNTDTVDATQIYPPIRVENGNLIDLIDPTNNAERADIDPTSQNRYKKFCLARGCDYTLRVTFADDSQQHVAISGAFRPWTKPSDPITAAGYPEAFDDTKRDSYKVWAANLPATQALKKLELLKTPKLWEGIGSSPVVLATRNVPWLRGRGHVPIPFT
jgi:hypothetical protein